MDLFTESSFPENLKETPGETAGKQRAPRNRTITLTDEEKEFYLSRCLRPSSPLHTKDVENRTIWGEISEITVFLPPECTDLLFIDPPYNMDKKFASRSFSRTADEEYEEYIESWFKPLLKNLKPTASVYVCSDWRSSAAVYRVLNSYTTVRNRITWEREKGRGARSNWKNSSEDIWFATVSKDYYFDVEAVKIKRSVVAPYRDTVGNPKDWEETEEGRYRLTHPSNLWTDITVPYWSMPENTDHPTQKPEKLLAKIILASSSKGDLVFDPFLGSGTTSVTATKLGRRFLGIEREAEYAALAEKRLDMAFQRPEIQGYRNGVFLHRNSRP
ncbi:MAG: DNA-methyltransferase [Sediminispirochaetaceae bacterium]